MLYRSTRTQNDITSNDKISYLSVSAAIKQGLALDGGLFVPSVFPHLSWQKINECSSLAAKANYMLEPFFKGDPLLPKLTGICDKAFDFPLETRQLEKGAQLLELFHGPTAAFKDFGAQFLAQTLGACADIENRNKELLILVATSGDTGGAVASAFSGVKGIRVAVLFPANGISPLQEKQLTCWDDNIISLKVDGTFDECQALVKDAFTQPEYQQKYELTSANSINMGRLLPQMVYYGAHASEFFKNNQKNANYIIPVGNMGNALACLYAKKCNLPIGNIILSSNANKTLVEFFDSGQFRPRASIKTYANAMDVGAPSNLERFRDLYPEVESTREFLNCLSISDDQISSAIKHAYEKWKIKICPHTATAVYTYLMTLRGEDKTKPWTLVSTAHGAKFKEVVEPLVGELEMPPSLQKLLDKGSRFKSIAADREELKKVLNL